MGLPWFGFNIKDFASNTLRLNTEAKGAYLMLMLDYYEHEEGPPDDDEVLATITGLSISTWQRHARVIRPLFSVVNGRLYQERIIEEIAKGHARHSSSMKGVRAMAAKHAAKKGLPPPSDTENNRQDDRQVSSEDDQQDASRSTHLHKHSIEKKEGAPYVAPPRAPIPEAEVALQEDSLVPVNFTPSPIKIIDYQNEGYSSVDISTLIDRFKRFYGNQGTMSQNWQGTWDKYWDRKKPVLTKAKPRIEVSTRAPKPKPFPIPDDWKPNATNARLAAEHGYVLDDIEQHFRDVCGAKGYLYLDHHLAFNNFIRNQKGFTRGNTNGKAPGPDRSIVNAAIRRDADLDREIAALEAGQPDGGVAVLGVSEGGLRQPGNGAEDDGDGS